jgi:hypothetical protein
MRKNVILGFFTAALVVLGTTSASALTIDATIAGIFTNSGLGTPVGDLVIDGSGDATATLAVGNAILVNVNIDNTGGESLETIGATITFQGDQTQFVGGIIPGSILQEAGFGGGSLSNLGSAIKGNSPNPQGVAGDVWQQALAYGSAGGVNGTGTQTADIQLLFIVTGAVGSPEVVFDLGFTAGDVITAPGGALVPTTFSGAVVNVPEPSSFALALASLGMVGLITRVRRQA